MFINKLSDADSEAAETQVWLEFAVDCEYLRRDEVAGLYRTYNEIMGTLVGMINHADTWVLPGRNKTEDE
jgi:four helix bundle protein